MSDSESNEGESANDSHDENTNDQDEADGAGTDDSEARGDGDNGVKEDELPAGVAQANESTLDNTLIPGLERRTSSASAGSDDDGEGRGLQGKKTKTSKVPDGMISINFFNPKAPVKYQNKKIVISDDTSIADMRKTVCAKIGCPFRELLLEINGTAQWVGRVQPFKDSADKHAKVRWKKIKRLNSFIDYNKVGGLNGRDGRYGRTVLHYGAIVGDLELCQEILNDKAIDPGLVNVRDKLGDTAMTLAAIAGFGDIVNLCIEKQGDMETQNVKGRTAMLLGAEHGHTEVVQTLLISNANIGPVPGTTRPTPMYLAELNHRDGVRLTIKQYLRSLNDDPLFDL